MTKFFRTFMFALIAMSFVLAACAPATTQAPEPTDAPPATEAPAITAPEPTAVATDAPAEDPMAMYAPDAVSGEIIAAGSSTVFPLAERMKQRFEEEGFTGNITIDSIGSGAGLERFCKTGETDIAMGASFHHHQAFLTGRAVPGTYKTRYVDVARGDADLYLRLPQPASSDRRENIWDHAAGAIVIEEAGGRVSDLFGQPLDFSHGSKLSQNQGIVASNGHIHDRVLAAIRDR